ncbi:replication initiation protein [Viridibacillus arvi]|uniref:replication initiation protein n=1 Tax=Viridibacillus arvi TaxID=263475 RepID=UPI003CFC0FB7
MNKIEFSIYLLITFVEGRIYCMEGKYDNYVVTKSHDLIEAKQKRPLTLREQKLVLMLVSTIQPSDEDFKEYQISVSDYCETMNISKKSAYHPIKKSMDGIASKTIGIEKEPGRYLVTSWVSSIEYIEGKGLLNITFDPKLKPYLLQLKAYSSYKLKYVLSLESVYSIRLYELVKKWHVKKLVKSSKVIELKELREKMGAIKKSYDRYSNFKIKLTDAIREINEGTDVFISFEEIKRGRSIDSLKFYIESQETEINKNSILENKNQLDEDKQLEQEYQRFEEMRSKLNEQAQDFFIDGKVFAEMYGQLLPIWNDAVEEELMYLIEYINKSVDIEKPIGFMKYKVKDAVKDYTENKEKVSFAELLETLPKKRQESENKGPKVPDWFVTLKKGEQLRTDDSERSMEDPHDENSSDVDFEEEKRKILAKMGQEYN